MELVESNRMETVGSVRLKPIALPVEHGGWGLLAEPIALGLLVAPSTTGALLCAAAVGAFLTRQPLKVVLVDWMRGRRSQRTFHARRFVLLYSSVALLSFAAAILLAPRPFLLPLFLATPAALIQLIYDATGRSRSLLPELAGAAGIASVVAAMALVDGFPSSVAFVLWALVVARGIPTILYLRARLRKLHRKDAKPLAAITAHVIAVAAGIALVKFDHAPLLAVVALIILLVRAVAGLLSSDMNVRAKTLGIREFIFGALFVLAVFAGYQLGW
jgi:hypothetical protein